MITITRCLVIIMMYVLLSACAPEKSKLSLGFWNVENLFDLENDPLTDDDEFAAGGRKQVTEEILQLKLDHLAEVLVELDVDILGLAEVENRAVLEMLNKNYSRRNYRILHFDSPDERGIDVALLVNERVFQVRRAEAVPVWLGTGNTTRDILYVTGRYRVRDLHLFVNHWPSHYGGTEETFPFRVQAARVLRARVDDLLRENPQAEILIMGDLNDRPADPSVRDHLRATLDRNALTAGDGRLLNLMAPFENQRDGATYKYRGEDRNLDQIIVSPGLLDLRGLTIVEGSLRIIDGPPYRRQTGKYTGYPFRFWAGDSLLGGYSDHLAVKVDITIP